MLACWELVNLEELLEGLHRDSGFELDDRRRKNVKYTQCLTSYRHLERLQQRRHVRAAHQAHIKLNRFYSDIGRVVR